MYGGCVAEDTRKRVCERKERVKSLGVRGERGKD